MSLTPKQLIDAGEIKQALDALAAVLRNKPTDTAARTTLFELLCFSGEWERAEKHLNLLAGASEPAKIAAIVYFAAIHAEKDRHGMYKNETFPKTKAKSQLSGKLNGKPFTSIEDADTALGARLEVFGAGSYMWLPFEHVQSIHFAPVKNLRDTLWTTARIQTGPTFQGTEIGEVLTPAIYPFSFTFPDTSVMLGRQTIWAEDDNGGSYPLGQKMLLVDGEEVPLLEIKSIEFDVPEGASQAKPAGEAAIELNS